MAPAPADAYIGPGAGFALLSSFLVLLTTVVVAFLSLLFWPFRQAWRMLRRRQQAKPTIGRLVIVGFDGQEPKLTDRWMKEGKLPNFSRLSQAGCYHRIKSTFPSVSPVAWSSFSTGTNPGRHNIFDFLDRDRRTYLPLLSSTKIGDVERFLRIGRYRIPLQKPELRLLRKSKPFWTILGEHQIWSTVLRVPITFPPDRFYGAQLSAMSVPDLLGTQGTFTLFTTRPAGERFKEGGQRVEIGLSGDRCDTVMTGPPNSFLDGSPACTLPLAIALDRAGERVRITVSGTVVDLEQGVLSPWITLSFRAAPGVKVSGICRMMLVETDPHVSIYMTPLNIDPDKPAMPISHPSYYATYLARKIGKYATLGLAEDTWALNEQVVDDRTFLQQTFDIDDERQRMFMAALDRLRQGALVCVFDATDRIQHMFWRYMEAGHPAARHATGRQERDAIERLYRRNDEFLGRVMERMREDDVLMVVSDHGFSSFRRGVNLNAWLHANGYLTLRNGADGTAEWLRDVDWSATRAYALGLTGMFLNLRGREAQGIVEPGAEAEQLKAELIAKLTGLLDDGATGAPAGPTGRDDDQSGKDAGRTGMDAGSTGGDARPARKGAGGAGPRARDIAASKDAPHGQAAVGIRAVFDTARIYNGPYTENAPDLLIGYDAGYRTSWDCASGVVAGPVFEDNVKAWSGDHCIDPRLVPGIFLCNRRIDVTEPALWDIAPTALTLFGIEPPAYMEGQALFRSPGEETGKPAPAADAEAVDQKGQRQAKAHVARGAGARR